MKLAVFLICVAVVVLAIGFVEWVAKFQHTAARRRLVPLSKALLHQVSQA